MADKLAERVATVAVGKRVEGEEAGKAADLAESVGAGCIGGSAADRQVVGADCKWVAGADR